MTDLWPDFLKIETDENRAVDILRTQARVLEQKTKGKVKASCSKIKYRTDSMTSMAATVAQAMAATCLMEEEVPDDKRIDIKDANELFSITRYKFEVYNDTYRFRVFVLNNRIVFPITIDLDAGIKAEIKYDSEASINSNDEFESTLKMIFASSKLKSVIIRMLQTTK